ncbi:MAG: RimK/LysX family protein [Desulfurivibrionaceae bacterium]
MQKNKADKNSPFPSLFSIWVFVVFLIFIALPAAASEKTTIGEVEDLILLPWGVTIAARIDTGAATSSLDVCEVNVKDKLVEFTLPDRCGGAKYTLPLRGWKEVKSASGLSRRPVVKIGICIAGKKIPTKVTLTDRSFLEYPFLLGRNTLRAGKFIVDVGLAKTFPPACPGIMPP